MKKNKWSKYGFTLIELLVVIAIIGVLTSIVLTSLSNSKNKATDAKIKTQLSNLRSAAELYYGGSGNNTYGAAVNDCTTVGRMFTDPVVSPIISTLTSPKCVSTGTGYAVSVPLVYSSGNHWCVDYKGASKMQAIVQPNGDDTCG